MAQSSEVLKVKIEADDKATPRLRLLKTEVESLNKGFNLLNPTLLGVGVGVTGLVALMTKAVNQFAEQELAVKRLTVALKNQGVVSKEYSGLLQRNASALQRMTGETDETILSAQALLATFGIIGTKLDVTTKAALDLAAATGVSLETAVTALAKAYQGSTTALGRMGVKIDESIPKSEKFAAALDAIQKQMGGQAEAQKNTIVGSFKAFTNAMNESLESIGELISKTGILQQTFKSLSDALNPPGGKEQRQSQLQALNADIEKIRNRDLSKAPASTISFYEKQLSSLLKKRDELNALIDYGAKREKDILKVADDQLKINEARKKSEADALKVTEMWAKLEEKIGDQKIELLGKEGAMHGYAIQNLKMINELNDTDLKTLQDKTKELDKQKTMLEQSSSTISNLSSGNFGGIISQTGSGVATSMGATAEAAGPLGAIAAGITELVINSKEIPDKIRSFMKSFFDGLEGIPELIAYLNAKFIPDLVKGLAGAIGGIFSDPVGLLKSVGDVFTFGAVSAISGLFGGGPSPEEKLVKTIEKLSDTITDLRRGLVQSGLDILASTGSASFQDKALAFRSATSINDFNIASQDFTKAGRKGDAEAAKDAAERVQQALLDQMSVLKDRYDLELERIQKLIDLRRKDFEEQVRMQEAIREMALRSIDNINAAIQAVKGGLLSPEQNVEQLRAAFNAASTPEARSSAASLLAGGLQDRFAQAQSLAAQGAITGEELARIQESTLAELERLKAEQQAVVDAAQKQIEVLQAGFDAFVAKMEETKNRLTDKLEQQIEALMDIKGVLSGQKTSIYDILRAYKENVSNARGTIR